MATTDSFRELVAEVIGKYPQYEQTLDNFKAEHTLAKSTLQETKNTLSEAKDFINSIEDTNKEYLNTLEGIRNTAEQARDSALRHLEDTQAIYDKTLKDATQIKTDTQGIHDKTDLIYQKTKESLENINKITQGINNLKLEEIVKDILNQNDNLEVAFTKVLNLLVLEPNYITLREEILENSRILLKDIKEQGKIAYDFYKDSIEKIKEKRNEGLILYNSSLDLNTNIMKVATEAKEQIATLRDTLFTLIRDTHNTNKEEVQRIHERNLYQIENEKTKAIIEIEAKKGQIAQLHNKAQEILKDSKEIHELTQNYAFALKVRQYHAISTLRAVQAGSLHIENLMTKARLEYVEAEAHISAKEAEQAKEQTNIIYQEAKQELEAFKQDTLTLLTELLNNSKQELETLKQDTITNITDLTQDALADFKQISEQTKQETEQLKQDTINETNQIKQDLQTYATEQELRINQQLEEATKGKEWIQEKMNVLYIVANLPQAGTQ